MDWKESYKQKLVSVEEAAKVVKSNDVVYLPSASSCPVELANTICKRKEELFNVTFICSLIFHPFECLKAEYKGHIKILTHFMGPYERAFYDQGNIDVCSVHYSYVDWMTENVTKPNVFITDVSPPDENGNMSYGPLGVFCGHTVANIADTIIVQVNEQTPYIYGPREAFINVKDVDYICEIGSRPLVELPQIPISDAERQIASHIIPYIEDGSTIQIGIGGISNAVGYFLENHKNLGIHSEMLVDSMMTLMEKGVVNGSQKTLHPGEAIFAFSVGSKKLYEYMNRNEQLKIYPVNYVNDPMIVAQNNKFIAINNALMCDLTGQICSESIGFRQFSGTGGQVDFVRGAFRSPGGKAFICLESTYKKSDGTLASRINSVLPPGSAVTTPRTDVRYVVTEFGVADLACQNFRDRVTRLINIAHPMFQEQLEKEAYQYGIIK